MDFAKKNGLDKNDYSRFKFINLWRATSPGPHNWSLALCRGDMVDDDEGVTKHLMYVDKIPDLSSLPEELPFDPMYSEGSLFTYKDNHYWTYYSDMKKDEIMFFTLYDSKRQRPWRVLALRVSKQCRRDKTTRERGDSYGLLFQVDPDYPLLITRFQGSHDLMELNFPCHQRKLSCRL